MEMRCLLSSKGKLQCISSISLHEACVEGLVADTMHSPNNSSVVSEIGSCEQMAPPNKTTTLKFGPMPNAMAE